MCAQLVFCRKFNSQQLLFEAFFYITGNFGSVDPLRQNSYQNTTLSLC